MKLTNEEITRIFALYWGAECNFGNPIRYGTIGAISTQRAGHQYCVLLLRPLSDITNEHLLKIGKMFNSEYEWTVKEKSALVAIIECIDYKLWIWFNDGNSIEFDAEEKFNGKENIEAHGGESDYHTLYGIVDIIDQLRQWGYALPYKGQSLFELGIAIKKMGL